MCYFSFIVAPVAFSVLPQQQLAGNVVSRNLAATEFIGMGLGLLLIALLLFSRERNRRRFLFELIALALMVAAMAISRFHVSNRLHGIRLQFGEGIAALPASDPAKITFDLLHRISVGLMSFDMIAALALIVLLVRSSRNHD
jgi:hypothetical protein